MKSKILGLLAVGLLAGPSAEALTLTLDSPHQNVVRPVSGTVLVEFFGTVGISAGEQVSVAELFYPFLQNSSTRLPLISFCPGGVSGICFSGGSGLLFSYSVSASDAFGLYGFKLNSSTPTYLELRGNSPTGQPVSALAEYSINVVPGSVPEPGTLALLGLGLAGLGLSRRRKAN